MSEYEYRTFGPHIVYKPANIELACNVEGDAEAVRAMTLLDVALEVYCNDGWELLQVISGFPIMVDNRISKLALPKGSTPPPLGLMGACVLMRRAL